MTTIDAEVEKRNWLGPSAIKLDTHGFEVPILEGAVRTLDQAEVLIIECYNFNISPESIRFPELCRYLEPRGFRCFDLINPRRRPNDQVLFQMDMVFLRSDRPEFKDPTFRGLKRQLTDHSSA